MRLDRLFTLNLIQPCRRLARRLQVFNAESSGRAVPILMYHSVSDEPEENVSAYYRTATSPEMFAGQMELLKQEGYEVTGLKDGLDKFRHRSTRNGKLAVLTFDDGFHDFYTAAHPVLRRHGFSATVFLPTAFIGNEPRNFKARACMTWNEVRELEKAGIEFGSHTVNHPKLYELGLGEIRAELETSKKTIEEQLGKSICSFAYPYAFPSADCKFVGKFVDLLQAAGYEFGVTTKIGRFCQDDDLFTLKRLPVNSCDDPKLFQAKLEGGYDWLERPQEMMKKFKLKVLAAGKRHSLSAQTAGVPLN